MYVRTGLKILNETRKIPTVIAILTNREYSGLMFLKTMQITNAQRTIPQALISFI